MTETNVKPVIDESWKEQLIEQFNASYFAELKQFIVAEKKQYVIYPPAKDIFAAFNHTPFDKVKVVIIGQDPYHGPNQANGLCFSVADGIKPPPSLVNIFKELNSDINMPFPTSGNLEKWAKQGVLLLNATLTVRKSQAGAHQKKGWEQFTDAAIKQLSANRTGLVFLLWGRFAQNKAALIDASKHHILKTTHPSPFSAHNGFLGSKHFSKANELLEKQGITGVDWTLS
jgi:uracil-DNA glycosylase